MRSDKQGALKPPYLRLTWQQTVSRRISSRDKRCTKYAVSRQHSLNECFLRKSTAAGFVGSSAMVSEDAQLDMPVRMETTMDRHDLETVARIRRECEQQPDCSSMSYEVFRSGIPRVTNQNMTGPHTIAVSLLFPSHPDVETEQQASFTKYDFTMLNANWSSFFVGQGPPQICAWIIALLLSLYKVIARCFRGHRRQPRHQRHERETRLGFQLSPVDMEPTLTGAWAQVGLMNDQW